MVHGLTTFVSLKNVSDNNGVKLFLETNKKIPVEVYANNEKYYSETNLADRSAVG